MLYTIYIFSIIDWLIVDTQWLPLLYFYLMETQTSFFCSIDITQCPATTPGRSFFPLVFYSIRNNLKGLFLLLRVAFTSHTGSMSTTTARPTTMTSTEPTTAPPTTMASTTITTTSATAATTRPTLTASTMTTPPIIEGIWGRICESWGGAHSVLALTRLSVAERLLSFTMDLKFDPSFNSLSNELYQYTSSVVSPDFTSTLNHTAIHSWSHFERLWLCLQIQRECGKHISGLEDVEIKEFRWVPLNVTSFITAVEDI